MVQDLTDQIDIAMWLFLLLMSLLPAAHFRNIRRADLYNYPVFEEHKILFSSNFNITKILVPVDGKYLPPVDIPSIFFTISDPSLHGGSCIYVLAGFSAFEVLEGGRDSTADYGIDKSIYFGAKDGLYKYDAEAMAAKKVGTFKEDIIQLQKANSIDEIYVLLANNSMYKLLHDGTVPERIKLIECATEFVLDTSNNIYYVSCEDKQPKILLHDGRPRRMVEQVKFEEVKLLRPAFIMKESIPLFGDSNLYILDSKGNMHKKDFKLEDKPTAYSLDTALYVVAALDGKLYEFNIMEVLVMSMYGLISKWPNDLSRMVLTLLDSASDITNSVPKKCN